MTNLDLIQDAIRFLSDNNSESAISTLKQFVRANTTVPRNGKLNIFNWCSTEKWRPIFTGVFHDMDNKVAVATDQRVMLVVKSLYQEPSEDALISDGGKNRRGYIVNKKGEYIEGLYPNYSRCFPEKTEEVEIDFDRLRELLREIKADEKALGKECFGVNVSTTPEKPIFLRPKYAKLLLTLPVGKFSVGRWGVLCYKSNDGDVKALLMGVVVSDEHINQAVVWGEEH
jgi:hypothetical protein